LRPSASGSFGKGRLRLPMLRCGTACIATVIEVKRIVDSTGRGF